MAALIGDYNYYVGRLKIGIERGQKPVEWNPQSKFEKYFVRGIKPQGPVIRVTTKRKGRGKEGVTTVRPIREYSPEQQTAFRARKLAVVDLPKIVAASLNKKETDYIPPFVKPSILSEEKKGKQIIQNWNRPGGVRVIRKRDTESKEKFDAIFQAIKSTSDVSQSVASLAVERAAFVTGKRLVRTLKEMTVRHDVVFRGVLKNNWQAQVSFQSRKSGAVTYNEIVVDVNNKAKHAGPVLRGANPETVWADINKLKKWVLAKGLKPRLRKRKPRTGIDINPKERIIPRYQKRESYVTAVARVIRYAIWNYGMKPSPKAIALQQDTKNAGRNIVNSIYTQALKTGVDGKPIGTAYQFAQRQILRAAKKLNAQQVASAARQARYRASKKKQATLKSSSL